MTLSGTRSDRAPDYRYQVLRLLWKGHPWLTVGTILCGLASGYAGVAVIDTINKAIHNGAQARGTLAWLFVSLSLAELLFRNGAAFLPAVAARDTMIAFRKALCKRILGMPLEDLERHGLGSVLNLLTRDIPKLTDAMTTLPSVFVQAAILVFAIGYLAILSLYALSMTVTAIAFGLIIYKILIGKSMLVMRQARAEQNVFYVHTHTMVLGIKELKLNKDRRRWFMRAALDLSTRRTANYQLLQQAWSLALGGVGFLTHSTLIGLLVFMLPMLIGSDASVPTAAVLVVIYMVEPLTSLLQTVPRLGEGVVACERLAGFGMSIDDPAGPPVPASASPGPSMKSRAIRWHSVLLRGISKHYTTADAQASFAFGPVDLELHPGELVYIIGGNGSGKSTLAKILCGLYIPSAGTVTLDGDIVDDEKIEAYRNMFSSVFSDFYLFDRIISAPASPDVASRANRYLETLGLETKVKIDQQVLSTTLLSTGQRKRLALLCAYMEDRPIYILDEWAADQDPIFKRIFYEVLVPDLKERGKCVVVITHDERYFHLADRIIKLEDGKVVETDGHLLSPALA